ncbi:O-fucosyltransferase 7 [Linum grandiflorum]
MTVPPKRRRKAMAVMRKMLTCAICAFAMVAVLSVHVQDVQIFPHRVAVFPDSYKLPTTTTTQKGMTEQQQSWSREVAPPHSKAPIAPHQMEGVTVMPDVKLWKPPSNRDYSPCVRPSSNYTAPGQSSGYLLVHTNGGLNQMRAGICDMVAVARIINATLVIPELDKNSFWQDTSNFSDVFDEKYFISSLASDVRVVRKLPREIVHVTKAVKHFKSWSGMDYYQEVASLWNEYKVIRAAKSDSRLANNNLPPDVQKLRCRACYEALRFSPRIEAMGKLLVDRMRAYGPYIALHLRYEKDMLAFSGCAHGLSAAEANELKNIRESTQYWKIKDIDSEEQRLKGYCPLTPTEVAMFLTALGYPSSTPIYIAAGEIYGGDAHMGELLSRYPLLMSKVNDYMLNICSSYSQIVS